MVNMFCYCFASNSSHYLKKKQNKTCSPRVQNICVEYKAFSHPTDYLHSVLFSYLYIRAHHKDICDYGQILLATGEKLGITVVVRWNNGDEQS